MRITLFILYCLLTLMSAIRAVTGETNKYSNETEEKRSYVNEPFSEEKYPVKTKRESVDNSILSVIVFAISSAILLLLVLI